MVPEQRIGTDRTVDLGHHDTLRQESAAHSHFVGFPFIDRTIDVERSEKGDVLPSQIRHDGVTQAAVRHVDDCTGADRIGLSALDQSLHVADRIDRVAGLFQPGDQFGRLAHLPRDDHPRGIRFQQSVLRKKGFVVLHAVEIQLLRLGIRGIGMVKLFQISNDGRLGLLTVEMFAVDRAAQVDEHVAVVAAPSAGKIRLDGGYRGRIGRKDLVGGIGRHGCNDDKTPVGSPLEGVPFLGRDAEPHAVHQHYVITSEPIEMLRFQRSEPDAAVVVCPGDLSEGGGLIVYKCDARGREPDVPCRNARCDGKQRNGSPKFQFSFHFQESLLFFS